jgi:hypothetical protein
MKIVDKLDVRSKWAQIAEHIAARAELKAAVMEIGAYQIALADKDHRDVVLQRAFSLPTDQGMLLVARHEGFVAGYEQAIADITDAEHIAEERDALIETNETRKELDV